MGKKRAQKASRSIFLVLLMSVWPLFAVAQSGNDVVDFLIGQGFENVSWAENGEERVYVVENSAYRLSGVGIGVALDEIQKHGLPVDGKRCRLIVLDNNVPMISLWCVAAAGKEVTRNDWKVGYDLGESWELVKKEKRYNSSLFKVDVLVYPEFNFRNSRLSRPYQVRFNMNPTVQVSLWKGGKVNAQIIVPVVNDYGYKYDDVRPGFLTVSQTVRLPYNVFVTGTVGFFNNNRAGFDLQAEYHPSFIEQLKGRFWIDGRVSYTVWGEWGEWEYFNGIRNVNPFKFGYSKDDDKITGQLGVNYYWAKYNTQFAFRGESFLGGDCGVRFDMIRHFRYCSIGFYGTYIPSDWWNDGINAGFRFQITLPPYKYKRKGYIPRVMPGRNWGFAYNAAGAFVYGQRFRANIDDNISNNIKYNPYYLKSELLNF
ncbi:MAG: hypothetical protein IJ476_03150 [Bacteroidales bacterium]|nr:hypothetical protein [Bacteroidales bacterium]